MRPSRPLLVNDPHVWGLIDRPVRLVRLNANGCAELLAGYQVLTGAEPLHGYTDACQADDP